MKPLVHLLEASTRKAKKVNLYTIATALQNGNEFVLLVHHIRAMNGYEARGKSMCEVKREYPNTAIISMVETHITQVLLDWAQKCEA